MGAANGVLPVNARHLLATSHSQNTSINSAASDSLINSDISEITINSNSPNAGINAKTTHNEHNSNASTTSNISSGEDNSGTSPHISRLGFYEAVIGYFRYYGFNGTGCLLRTICEVAADPHLQHSNGIWGSLFRILFTYVNVMIR